MLRKLDTMCSFGKMDIAGGKGGSRQYKNFIVDFGPHAYHTMTKEVTGFMKKHSNNKLMDINYVVPNHHKMLDELKNVSFF